MLRMFYWLILDISNQFQITGEIVDLEIVDG